MLHYLHFRDHYRTDSDLGVYKSLLCQLSNSIDPKIEIGILRNKLDKMLADMHYHIYLAIDDDHIVGTATLLLEETFLHDCSLNAHLENLVVHDSYRGQGIASHLIDLVIQHARQDGAYKLILDCVPEIQHLYAKSGFQVRSVQMRMDFDH